MLAAVLRKVPLVCDSRRMTCPQSLGFFGCKIVSLGSGRIFTRRVTRVVETCGTADDMHNNRLRICAAKSITSFCQTTNDRNVLIVIGATGRSMRIGMPVRRTNGAVASIVTNISIRLPAMVAVRPCRCFVCRRWQVCVGRMLLAIMFLKVTYITVTRRLLSPGKGLGLGIILSSRKKPICDLCCGKRPIMRPSTLKVLVRRTSLSGNFQVLSTAGSAFSRA